MAKVRNIFLVENYPMNIKESYSNLKKVHDDYGFSYWTMYHHIRRKEKKGERAEYRNKDYIITKLELL